MTGFRWRRKANGGTNALRPAGKKCGCRKAEEAHKAGLAKAKADSEAASRPPMPAAAKEGLREGEKEAVGTYGKSLDDLRNNARAHWRCSPRRRHPCSWNSRDRPWKWFPLPSIACSTAWRRAQAEAVFPLISKAMTAMGEAEWP